MQRDGREIGSLIKTLIFGNKELKKMIKGGVFPFPAIESTEFPFITYQIHQIQPYYTKDVRDYQDSVTIELLIWSTDYSEKIKLATEVYNSLQDVRGVIEGFDVTESQRVEESEMFMEDAYGQSIVFNIEIQKSWQ